ncbi:hypothetical protein RB598_004569 [Gaeumannomyces tritici]
MADNAPVFSQSFLPLPEHEQPSTPAGAFHDTIAATYHQQQHQQQQQQQQQQHDLLSTLSFNLAVNHAQQTLCADCLRRYARPEHLQRHIATHTLGKRFACDVCGKAFGRADLLKRHRANHEEDPTGMKKRRLASAPGAARVAEACAGCARARVKCEEVKPCARCRTRGIPCKYSSSAGVSPYHSIHRRTTSPDGSGRGTSRQARPSKSPSPGFTQEQPQKSQLYQMPTSATSPPIGSVDVVPGSYPDFSGGSAAFGFSTAQPSLVMQSEGTLAAVTPRNFTPDVNVPFSDFMRGILYQHGTDTPSDTTSLHGLAVLDFCNTSNLELDDIDFSFLGNWGIARDGASLQQAPQLHQHQQEQQVETQHQQHQHEYQQQCDEDSCTSDGDSPGISGLRHRLVKLWDDDRLRWAPNPQNTGYDDQENFPVPSATAAMAEAASFAYDALEAVSSRVDDSPPDLLACCAAAGATMTPNLTLRKFGFAVQEAVGIVIPKNFEDNNQRTSDRALIEIAECHTDILITMMRYRNRFKMTSYPVIHVAANDSGAELEAKWTQWRDQESWKRLVFHCFMRDAQISFTSLRGSHMSYAELTLPLPAPSQVWAARDASEWQAQYLATMALAEAIMAGLCSTLDSFAVDTMGWSELTEVESLTLQLLQLHLHVSLDDLQAASAQSRRALWHAGQILRLARAFPRGRLKDSSAIAVHHAALALWTYGVVTRAAAVASAAPTPSPRTQRSSTSDRDRDRDCGGGGGGDGLVFLDGPHSPQVADFVAFGQGRAAIHASRDLRQSSAGHDSGGDWGVACDDGSSAAEGVAPLSESRACMQVAQEVLRANFTGEDGHGDGSVLPIIENLCCLLARLGSAADGIRKR